MNFSNSAFAFFAGAASGSSTWYHDATPQLFLMNSCFLFSLISCCLFRSSTWYLHYPFFPLKIGLPLNNYFSAPIFTIICLPLLSFLQTFHRLHILCLALFSSFFQTNHWCALHSKLPPRPEFLRGEHPARSPRDLFQKHPLQLPSSS